MLLTPDGQPWRVPQGQVTDFLNKGYRRPDPLAVPIASPAQTVLQGDRINVNTDSPTRIAKVLPGVGTATVKHLKENRPYASIEDLIAKVPLPAGATWTQYSAQLEFDQDAA